LSANAKRHGGRNPEALLAFAERFLLGRIDALSIADVASDAGK
jgi:hypothetical protein